MEKNNVSSREKRFRNFCLMSYCNEYQIQKVLEKHSSQLKAYAYILHDKDIDEKGELKQPHYHILLALYNNTTVSACRNWFKGLTDENGLPVNTLGQSMIDIIGSFDYLTHNTELAKAENKFLYSADEVKGLNLEYFNCSELQEIDNLSLALDELLCGVPLVEVAKRFGRDFIIHYGHIKQLFNDIQNQLGGVCIE